MTEEVTAGGAPTEGGEEEEEEEDLAVDPALGRGWQSYIGHEEVEESQSSIALVLESGRYAAPKPCLEDDSYELPHKEKVQITFKSFDSSHSGYTRGIIDLS